MSEDFEKNDTTAHDENLSPERALPDTFRNKKLDKERTARKSAEAIIRNWVIQSTPRNERESTISGMLSEILDRRNEYRVATEDLITELGTKGVTLDEAVLKSLEQSIDTPADILYDNPELIESINDITSKYKTSTKILSAMRSIAGKVVSLELQIDILNSAIDTVLEPDAEPELPEGEAATTAPDPASITTIPTPDTAPTETEQRVSKSPLELQVFEDIASQPESKQIQYALSQFRRYDKSVRDLLTQLNQGYSSPIKLAEILNPALQDESAFSIFLQRYSDKQRELLLRNRASLIEQCALRDEYMRHCRTTIPNILRERIESNDESYEPILYTPNPADVIFAQKTANRIIEQSIRTANRDQLRTATEQYLVTINESMEKLRNYYDNTVSVSEKNFSVRTIADLESVIVKNRAIYNRLIETMGTWVEPEPFVPESVDTLSFPIEHYEPGIAEIAVKRKIIDWYSNNKSKPDAIQKTIHDDEAIITASAEKIHHLKYRLQTPGIGNYPVITDDIIQQITTAEQSIYGARTEIQFLTNLDTLALQDNYDVSGYTIRFWQPTVDDDFQCSQAVEKTIATFNRDRNYVAVQTKIQQYTKQAQNILNDISHNLSLLYYLTDTDNRAIIQNTITTLEHDFYYARTESQLLAQTLIEAQFPELSSKEIKSINEYLDQELKNSIHRNIKPDQCIYNLKSLWSDIEHFIRQYHSDWRDGITLQKLRTELTATTSPQRQDQIKTELYNHQRSQYATYYLQALFGNEKMSTGKYGIRGTIHITEKNILPPEIKKQLQEDITATMNQLSQNLQAKPTNPAQFQPLATYHHGLSRDQHNNAPDTTAVTNILRTGSLDEYTDDNDLRSRVILPAQQRSYEQRFTEQIRQKTLAMLRSIENTHRQDFAPPVKGSPTNNEYTNAVTEGTQFGHALCTSYLDPATNTYNLTELYNALYRSANVPDNQGNIIAQPNDHALSEYWDNLIIDIQRPVPEHTDAEHFELLQRARRDQYNAIVQQKVRDTVSTELRSITQESKSGIDKQYEIELDQKIRESIQANDKDPLKCVWHIYSLRAWARDQYPINLALGNSESILSSIDITNPATFTGIDVAAHVANIRNTVIQRYAQSKIERELQKYQDKHTHQLQNKYIPKFEIDPPKNQNQKNNKGPRNAWKNTVKNLSESSVILQLGLPEQPNERQTIGQHAREQAKKYRKDFKFTDAHARLTELKERKSGLVTEMNDVSERIKNIFSITEPNPTIADAMIDGYFTKWKLLRDCILATEIYMDELESDDGINLKHWPLRMPPTEPDTLKRILEHKASPSSPEELKIIDLLKLDKVDLSKLEGKSGVNKIVKDLEDRIQKSEQSHKNKKGAAKPDDGDIININTNTFVKLGNPNTTGIMTDIVEYLVQRQKELKQQYYGEFLEITGNESHEKAFLDEIGKLGDAYEKAKSDLEKDQHNTVRAGDMLRAMYAMMSPLEKKNTKDILNSKEINYDYLTKKAVQYWGYSKVIKDLKEIKKLLSVTGMDKNLKEKDVYEKARDKSKLDDKDKALIGTVYDSALSDKKLSHTRTEAEKNPAMIDSLRAYLKNKSEALPGLPFTVQLNRLESKYPDNPAVATIHTIMSQIGTYLAAYERGETPPEYTINIQSLEMRDKKPVWSMDSVTLNNRSSIEKLFPFFEYLAPILEQYIGLLDDITSSEHIRPGDKSILTQHNMLFTVNKSGVLTLPKIVKESKDDATYNQIVRLRSELRELRDGTRSQKRELLMRARNIMHANRRTLNNKILNQAEKDKIAPVQLTPGTLLPHMLKKSNNPSDALGSIMVAIGINTYMKSEKPIRMSILDRFMRLFSRSEPKPESILLGNRTVPNWRQAA